MDDDMQGLGKLRVSVNIMIARPCNLEPFTTHFYLVKLGFEGYTSLFISHPKTYIVGIR